MAINCISPLLSGILLASFFQAVFLSENDGCPAIHVKKDQIIRTREALNNGAKYLHKEIVQSARECYKLCCGHDQCNLGMLSYKNNSMDDLVRTCFLFDCGSPSKCSFSPYKHYATISFDGERQGDSRGIKQSKSDSSQSSHGSKGWDKDCPPGAPVAMCSSDPCHTAICRSHPWAICRPSTCGTCHAEFFNAVGQRVKCYEYSKQAKTVNRHSNTNKWSDKNILKEIDSLHQNGIHNPPVRHRNHNTDLETHLQDYTRKNPSSQQISTGSSSKKIESTEPETDPPFHQWREFIDNNPKFGKPKLVTEKPTTKKPTTFHQWREFIDNNPKYTRRPAKTTTTKPTAKTTKKPMKPHVIPKTKPMIEENPMTNSPPKVDDESRRTGNITDVVVIETSNLRIVENKAVVPLAIFLVVALVMLFVVALRLRVTKRRLRRKAFATDDADYLINGMYL